MLLCDYYIMIHVFICIYECGQLTISFIGQDIYLFIEYQVCHTCTITVGTDDVVWLHCVYPLQSIYMYILVIQQMFSSRVTYSLCIHLEITRRDIHISQSQQIHFSSVRQLSAKSDLVRGEKVKCECWSRWSLQLLIRLYKNLRNIRNLQFYTRYGLTSEYMAT